jgi:DNA invertase Pin-like site-specific DNA recombinase/uncharacterized coiled-coil protein SlyX
MKPIDIYARVSSAKTGRSVEGQVLDCRDVLETRNLPVGQVHRDQSKSAWRKNVIRPAWNELMARLESGAAGGVIVYDLTRFSRRPIEGERLIVAAERGLVILDSEGEYDLTKANDKKKFRDQMSSAAYYSDDLQRKVKRGKRLKVMEFGEPNGTGGEAHRPFGFEPNGIDQRADEAEIIREMTRRFLAGETQEAIVISLNEREITTSYGKVWTRTALRQVLTRWRNAGLLTYLGVVVETKQLPGAPIIDRETLELVRAKFAASKRGRPTSPQYLCSGVATCACGTVLTGRPRINMKPYPDGEVKREYWCRGCGRMAIDQRGLDLHVGALVVAILGDPRHADVIEAAVRKTADQRTKLEAQVAEAEKLALQLSERLGRQEITMERYDAAVTPLDKRLESLRVQIAALPPADALGTTDGRATRAEWTVRWSKAETPEKRDLLRRALRGRALVVGPADPKDRTNVAKRVTVT